jgi:hypothetical protein
MSDEHRAGEQVLDLCCNGKKCPVFTLKNDVVRITDAEILGEKSIELTAEQLTKLRAKLESWGF